MRSFPRRHLLLTVSCPAGIHSPCARRHSSTDNNNNSSTGGEPSSGATGAKDRGHYRRRTSDPQTPRQRGDFQRDLKFGKRRPLPDAPWRQVKAKTYLDDAERLYGRKEQWHLVEDDVLREKLVTVLQDYLRDTISAIRLESRDATKYRRLCDTAAKEYRAHVIAGAYASPEMLRTWAHGLLRPGASPVHTVRAAGTEAAEGTDARDDSHPHPTHPSRDSAPTPEATSPSEEEAAAWLEARQRRGREAIMEGTPAMSDLPRSDAQRPSLSAFPFLRQRALEDEQSLDPSLVDWTAKYFPDDNATTFATPPTLRQRAAASAPYDADAGDDAETDRADSGAMREANARDGRHAGGGREARAFASQPRAHARHRLQSSLRGHNDRNRATFDAEGAFFHLRRQTEESERAPKPKPVRGSDESFAENATGVVKVPWGVVSAAKRRGYSTDTLRAKERLVRLSRGEDPETIP